MTVIAEKLDARGMNCPLPILRTRKALNLLESGAILEVITTDPGAVKDMASFCTQTGNRLVSSTEADNSYIFMIEKA
ncbi:MAG: sulfurtransferase TusA family protein [Gammaproteobacteria bacterium]|jgi:tRNA 2-thiouridine synthesizing protein A|nr:sulfurtransferase TusA family protein [Gammaproteobacteria bacterium]